jgi:hypothetical protein
MQSLVDPCHHPTCFQRFHGRGCFMTVDAGSQHRVRAVRRAHLLYMGAKNDVVGDDQPGESMHASMHARMHEVMAVQIS